MNKKFRVVAAVLIAMMILTLVAGCGKKTVDEEFDISAEGSLSGEQTDTATKPDASEDEEGDKTETPTEDTEKQDETPNEDTDKPTEETPSDTDKTEPETPDEEQKEPSADNETPSDDEKEPEQKPVEKPEPEQPQVTVTIPDISSVAEMNAQQALTALKGLPYGKLMEAWASYLAEDNADSRYGIYTFDLTNIRVDYDENNLITGVSFEAVEDEETEEETEEEE